MIAARGHEGLAPVWEGTSAPARCAVALCTWLPAQRPCSGGRAAPRCVMGTPDVRARPKRGAGRARTGRCPSACTASMPSNEWLAAREGAT